VNCFELVQDIENGFCRQLIGYRLIREYFKHGRGEETFLF